jgi:hypothetical protein
MHHLSMTRHVFYYSIAWVPTEEKKKYNFNGQSGIKGLYKLVHRKRNLRGLKD